MFAKLFSSITESSLWSEPKEVRLLFVTMLAKADQNGFVEASIPGLARVSNLTIEETERSLECLQGPDAYSKNPDNEGRRVLQVPGGFVLLNYEDYRSRRSTEERREYMREYMKDYRKKDEKPRKQLVNKRKQKLTTVSHGKPRLAQAETDADTDADTEKNTFDHFWSIYPRRVAKQNAVKAWRKAIKTVEPDVIIAGAEKYAIAVQGKEPQFIRHPATWLNGGCWDDEPDPEVKKALAPGTREFAKQSVAYVPDVFKLHGMVTRGEITDAEYNRRCAELTGMEVPS
jgi:hypothetical protein